MDAVMDPPKQKHARRYVPGRRITPKQQMFADAIATGMNYNAAAKQAGYKSTASAHEAKQHPLVREYLSSIQSRAAALVGHTVVEAMLEAKDGMDFAKETENATAFVKAVELRAKLSGLLIDRVEVFTADLKGAIEMAQARVVDVTPRNQEVPNA